MSATGASEMSRRPHVCRPGTHWARLAAVAAMLLVASFDAHAQSGALYRCGSNDYTNALTEEEAISRHCVKIGNAEWVFSGSDAAGRQYTYNDRRTVFRQDGTVETWLQVASPEPIVANAADRQALAAVRTVSPHVIHCRQRRISSGATYFLNMRDNSVSKDSNLRTDLFPPPERIAEALIRRLCVDRHGFERSLASR
jgi:hypothetical protein